MFELSQVFFYMKKVTRSETCLKKEDLKIFTVEESTRKQFTYLLTSGVYWKKIALR